MPPANICLLTTVCSAHSIKVRLPKLKPREKKTILCIKAKSRKESMLPKVAPSKECRSMQPRLLHQNHPKIFQKNRKSNLEKIYMAVPALLATKLRDKEFPVHFRHWLKQITSTPT